MTNNVETEKVFFTGTHRVRSPEATWDIVGRRLNDYGITRVADVTGLDTIGIPVAVAARPLARSLAVSQGKGHSLLLAKISAVMESIEMWHAEFACPPLEYTRTAPADLNLPYRVDQLDSSTGSIVTARTPLDWVVGESLCSGVPVPLPFDSVQLSISPDFNWRPLGLRVVSNGLASGNTVDEATLHALYELLERDALSGLSATEADPRVNIKTQTIVDDICSPLVSMIVDSGVFLEVALIRNRWNVPCFSAFVWSEDFPVLSAGSGAHSSVSVALSRAITEAVQSRLTAISGSRDDLDPMYSHVLRGSTKHPKVDCNSQDFLEITSEFTRTFKDIREEVDWVSQTVADLTGVDPIQVDLSTTEEFSVVKVVCCGLDSAKRHTVPRPDYGSTR